MVKRRSPKPQDVGSNPTAPANDFRKRMQMVIPSREASHNIFCEAHSLTKEAIEALTDMSFLSYREELKNVRPNEILRQDSNYDFTVGPIQNASNFFAYKNKYIIREEGDNPIAFCRYGDHFCNGKTFSLTNLFVQFLHRREGIATELINEVEKEAKKGGFSNLEVTVAPLNFPAVALYKKLGFTEDYYNEYVFSYELASKYLSDQHELGSLDHCDCEEEKDPELIHFYKQKLMYLKTDYCRVLGHDFKQTKKFQKDLFKINKLHRLVLDDGSKIYFLGNGSRKDPFITWVFDAKWPIDYFKVAQVISGISTSNTCALACYDLNLAEVLDKLSPFCAKSVNGLVKHLD